MPELLERVNSLPNICGIEMAFNGAMLPSAIEGYQEFYNSIPSYADFTPAHFGRASVSFDEDSLEDNAGISYRQKLTILFPASDADRASRIVMMHKVKFIKIKLSNNKDIILGRNDFEQNARIKVKTKLDERMAQAEFETVSIFPAGYVPSPVLAGAVGGIPTLFPINFINTNN